MNYSWKETMVKSFLKSDQWYVHISSAIRKGNGITFAGIDIFFGISEEDSFGSDMD